MTKAKQITDRVNSLTNHHPMQFSCFHDGMFVYEYCLDESITDWDGADEMLEFTFFPIDDAILTHCESIEELMRQADLTKYYSLSVSGDIDEIDISDALK